MIRHNDSGIETDPFIIVPVEKRFQYNLSFSGGKSLTGRQRQVTK